MKELGLWKPSGFPRPSDDFVALIEALPPPKAEALAWLEGATTQSVKLALHSVVQDMEGLLFVDLKPCWVGGANTNDISNTWWPVSK